MENVNKNIVEKLLCQEKVEGGEPGGLQSQGGHRLQAGHQHGEDRPAVEQGWVLSEGQQVPSVPKREQMNLCMQVHNNNTFPMLPCFRRDKYRRQSGEPELKFMIISAL